MTKMTCRTNPIIVVKVVNLDISRIYNCNHMVRMDKISFCVFMFIRFNVYKVQCL